MIRRVLFVCSGNTCRSSMAETLFRHKLAHHPAGWSGDVVVESAGVSAATGDPASQHAREAMAARGLDLTCHRAHRLTAEDIQGADLVIAMTRAHKRAALALAPSALARMYTLKELAGLMAADPERRREYLELREKLEQRLLESGHARKVAELDKSRRELLERLAKLDDERNRLGQKMASELSPEINRLEAMAGEVLDVGDPFGRDLKTYSQCADEIESHLEALLNYIEEAAQGPAARE